MNYLIYIQKVILSKLKNKSFLLNINEKKIIILGDPNSINSEIIYKSWKKLNNSR